MAKPTIDYFLEVQGHDKLKAALEDPALVAVPLRGLFGAAGDLAQKTSREGVKAGTGMAVRTIRIRMEPMRMQTYSVMPKRTTKDIEMGRSPGSRASLWQLANWVDRRVSRGRRLRDMSKEQKVTVRVIAQAIRQRGTKGRFFMRAAREAVQAALPRMLSAMASKIEQLYGEKVR